MPKNAHTHTWMILAFIRCPDYYLKKKKKKTDRTTDPPNFQVKKGKQTFYIFRPYFHNLQVKLKFFLSTNSAKFQQSYLLLSVSSKHLCHYFSRFHNVPSYMPSFAWDTAPVIVCVKDETENTSALSLKRQYILLLVVSPFCTFYLQGDILITSIDCFGKKSTCRMKFSCKK